MRRNFKAANAVRYEGAVPYKELQSEIRAFQAKWLIQTRDLGKIFGVPEGTVDSILNDNKSRLVMRDTAIAVRRAIRDYNPRTCQYRRFLKSDAAKILRDIKQRHYLTWPEVAQMVDYPESKIRQIVSPPSDVKYVPSDTLRHMLLSYQNYLKRRAETLQRESTHKIA